MKQRELIEHQGIVSGVQGEIISVNLNNISNCSGCHAKAMCNVSETDNKVIEVINSQKSGFQKGDQVIVEFEKSLGPKALLLGYLLPFFIVIFTLIISHAVTNNEVFSGVLSLLVLIPYYLVLYYLRSFLKKEFSFKLRAITKS